jgi:ribose/xylose/arabinose/galactoside ABC-type transport system permease subunit
MDQVGRIQSAAIGSPTTAERRRALAHIVSLVYRVLVPASPVILALAFGLYVPRVLSFENIINIIQQTAFLFVLTCAQTIVLLTRGLDLSLGPSVSMISVASALTMTAVVGSDGSNGSNGIIAALAGTASGLLIGLLVGLFNGIAVAWLRVNPFVATLASMNICLGIGTSLSDGHPVFGIPEEFNVAGYRLHVLGIPMSIIYAVAVGIALHLLLQYTVVGRSFYVLGSNPRAAIVAGWPRRRLLALAYILSALLTAVGALILTARAASGAPNLGGGLSLQTIAAAVIGGVSLTGGRGGLSSALIGSFFITILSNGMNLAEIGGYTQMLVMGAIVIFAVALDRVARMDV